MHAFLLVEDDDAIVVAFRVAVEEAYIPVVVNHVSDGKQAIEYLCSIDQLPAVVFLDLKMPKAGGWEVLRVMREDERLRQIPALIFTSSARRDDKERAYALGAQHFITKPASLAGLVAEIESAYRRFVVGEPDQQPSPALASHRARSR